MGPTGKWGALASDTLAVWRARARSSHFLSPLGTSHFPPTCLSFPICKIRPDGLNSLPPWPDSTIASQAPVILGFTQNLVPLNLKVNFVMYILQFRKEEVSAKRKKEEKEKEKNPQNPIPTAFWDLGARCERVQKPGHSRREPLGGAVPPPATRGRQRLAGLDLRLKSQAGWAALPPQPP